MPMPFISTRTMVGLRHGFENSIGRDAVGMAMWDADLPIASLETHRAYIPQLRQLRFFENAARRSGIENLAFALGDSATIKNYGLFGSYVTSAARLIDALHITRDLMPYHSSHDRLSVAQHKDTLRFNYHASVRNAEGYRHYATLAANVMLTLTTPFLGQKYRKAIEFNFPKPRNTAAFEDWFGCEVLFDQAELSIVFDFEATNQKRLTPIENIVTLEDVARDAFHTAPRDLAGAVSAIVRADIANQTCIGQVACRLDYSERTFRRRLEESGTNFRNIARQVRMETAQELISDNRLTLAEISERVGYSTPSHFTRAFKQHMGRTPALERALKLD